MRFNIIQFASNIKIVMKYIYSLVLLVFSFYVQAQSPFCAPTYSGTPNDNLCINSVSFNNFMPDTAISRANPTLGYTDNTNDIINLCAGATYNVGVNVSRRLTFLNKPGALANIYAWFDWDKSSDLVQEEEAYYCGNVMTSLQAVNVNVTVNGMGVPTPEDTTVNFNVTVPNTASGKVYLRFAIVLENSKSSCEEYFVGEVEDFQAMIYDYGSLNSNNTTITSLDSLGLSVNRVNTSDSIFWDFYQNNAFVNQTNLLNQAQVKYQPNSSINIVRAYKNQPMCIADEDLNKRAYTNTANIVKLGAKSIQSDLNDVCDGDSVNTFQTFGNRINTFDSSIPKVVNQLNSPDTSVINVSGVADTLLDYTTLNKVCLDISTNAMEVLSFVITSPNGTKSILSSQNGSAFTQNLEDYTFCFSDSVGANFINGVSANLDGTYNPTQSLDRFNFENPNGNWTLQIISDYTNLDVVAQLNSWSLEFGHQTFEGWTDATGYADASLDSAKTIATVNNNAFTANYNSELGNASDTIRVDVLSAQPFTIDSISSSINKICPGETVTFTAKTNNPAPSGSFSWFVNGNEIMGENDSIITIASLNPTDNIEARLDINNACNTSSDVDMIVIEGRTFKNASVQLNAGATLPVCENTTLNASAVLTDNQSTYTSEWFVNGMSRATDTENYTWPDGVDGDTLVYTFSQTDACGGVQNLSDTIFYESQKNIDLSVNLNLNDGVSFCENENISFLLTANDPNIPANYLWLLDGNDLSNDKADYQSNNIAVGNHTVEVSYFPNGGCYNQSSATSVLNFNVDASKNTSLNIQASEEEICEGDAVIFSVLSSSNLGASASYQWKADGLDIIGETSETLNLESTSANTVYSLEAVSSENCASPMNVVSNTVQLKEIKPKTADLMLDNNVLTEYCTGSTIQNSALIVGDAQASSFQWLLNDVEVSSEQMLPSLTIPDGQNTLELIVTFDDGCGVSFEKSVINNIVVYTPQQNDFTLTQNSSEYTTDILGTIDTVTTNFEWTLVGDGIFSSKAEPTFTLENDGDYTICVNTSRGLTEVCAQESCETFTYVGIVDYAFSSTFSVYPNPSNDVLLIDGLIENAHYQIIDASGKLMFDGNIGTSNNSINTSKLSEGLYQVIFSQSNKVVSLRFVKD